MVKHGIYQIPSRESALRQGEILTGVIQFKPNVNESSLDLDIETQVFTAVTHPYAIVVTQDCDLDWDYKARQSINSTNDQSTKLLNSILLCEIETARGIRDNKNVIINRKDWELVESHRHERFYFFQNISSECDLEQKGLPELTSDFKKVFGVDAGYLYHQLSSGKAKRRTVLLSPYLEHFSTRYHNFHTRVALPAPYESLKEG